jgi:hypothetical protein
MSKSPEAEDAMPVMRNISWQHMWMMHTAPLDSHAGVAANGDAAQLVVATKWNAIVFVGVDACDWCKNDALLDGQCSMSRRLFMLCRRRANIIISISPIRRLNRQRGVMDLGTTRKWSTTLSRPDDRQGTAVIRFDQAHEESAFTFFNVERLGDHLNVQNLFRSN